MPIESSSIFSSDLVLEQSFVYWKESDEVHFWESVICTMKILCHNVWFQKISRPPPQRELEIPGGWGGQAQEIPEGRGVGQ